MSFSVKTNGGATIVRVIENLTFVNQKEFLAIGDRLVEEGTKQAVLDLKDISYFGSMAFGLVAKTFNMLKEAGCRLVVVRPEKDEVFQVFKITRMVDLMEFYSTESEALEALGVTPGSAKTVVMEDVDPVQSKILKLSDSDPEVRRYTAWSLGLLGDARAVDALKECLNDSEVKVRDAAAESLEKITGELIARS